MPFQGDSLDTELLHLKSYLTRLLEKGENALETNRQVFGLERLKQSKESSQYLQQLQAETDINRWLSVEAADGRPTPTLGDSESC